jgi:hypothetical protein
VASVWINYIPGKQHLDFALTQNNGQIIAIEKNVAFKDILIKTQDPKLKVNVIINSPDIKLKKILLPKKYDSETLKKILPNILEEDILSPLEETRLSYSMQSNDNSLVCAIVNKSFIEAVKIFFMQHNIKINSIYPVSGLIDEVNLKKPAILTCDQNLVLLSPDYTAFILDLEFFNLLFSNNLTEAIKPNIPIDKFTVLNKNTDIWSLMSFKKAEFEFVITSHNKLDPYFNYRKYLKKTSVFLAFCLVLFLVRNMVVYDNYVKQSEQLDSEIQKLYKQIIPNASASLDPRARIESELKKKTGSKIADKKIFFELLYTLSSAVDAINKRHGSNNIMMVAFKYKYQDKKLKAVLVLNKNDLFEEFKSKISNDYILKETNIKKEKELYQIDLDIYKK